VNHEAILDLITTREATATTQAEHLHEQIGALTEQLAAIQSELADLATTRGTLLRLAGPAGPAATADTTQASTAYQQILAVFATTGNGLRAKDICHALGVGTTANHTESLRAKLKRLVARGVLIEPEPGLFTRPPSGPPEQHPAHATAT
jgi:hypothetical protein